MRIYSQQQIYDWVWAQKAKDDGFTYEDFARGVGREVQTVRGWFQETNRKIMPKAALMAASRYIREHERAESQIARTTADMSPDDWKRLAEVAQDQGCPFLWEFIGRICREQIEVADDAAKLADMGVELRADVRTLKRIARIKDDQAREEEDDIRGARLQGYAQALRDVARVL